MVDVGQLWVRLGLESAQFKAGLADAKQGLVSWRDETNKNTGEMAKWGAAIGATVGPIMAAVYASRQLSMEYGNMADQLKDLSYQTGISTDKLQQMQYAALISGTSFSTVSMALNKLTLSMQEAKDPTSAAYKAFMGLGVDPDGRTPEQVFDATTLKLVTMKDETQRNAYAMELYGRSYKELLPYMADYIKNAKEIEAAPGYTKKELDDLESAKVAWDKLGNSLTIYSGKAIAAMGDMQTKFNSINPGMWAIWGLTGVRGKTTSNGGASSTFGGAYTESVGSGADITLKDRFKDLTDAQIELIKTQDELTAAQGEYTKALGGTDQALLDKWSEKVATLTNKLAGLTSATKTADTSIKKSYTEWAASSIVGVAGSNMQLFMQKEMEAGTSYDNALNNWAAGTPTNSTQRTDTLGAQKEKKIYTEKTQALTKYNDETLNLYMAQEQQDLTHWTATTELLKTATDNMTKNWLEYVAKVGENPAIHNIGVVVWKEGQADWDPYGVDKFMQTSRMATLKSISTNFKSADFGAIKFSAKSETPKAGETTIKVVVPQGTPAGEYATTQANSRGLAKTVV